MPAQVEVSGAYRNVIGVQVEVGGSYRTVAEAWVEDGGVWRKWWPETAPLSVVASTDGQWNISGQATTGTLVSGGKAPYSYEWGVSQGADIAFGSPTNSSTNVTTSNRAVRAEIYVTVTDSSAPPNVVQSNVAIIEPFGG